MAFRRSAHFWAQGGGRRGGQIPKGTSAHFAFLFVQIFPYSQMDIVPNRSRCYISIFDGLVETTSILQDQARPCELHWSLLFHLSTVSAGKCKTGGSQGTAETAITRVSLLQIITAVKFECFSSALVRLRIFAKAPWSSRLVSSPLVSCPDSRERPK